MSNPSSAPGEPGASGPTGGGTAPSGGIANPQSQQHAPAPPSNANPAGASTGQTSGTGNMSAQNLNTIVSKLHVLRHHVHLLLASTLFGRNVRRTFWLEM